MHLSEKGKAPPPQAGSAAQKLLEAIVVMAQTHELRDHAVALWEAADDARGSAQALAAESAQARRRSRQLRGEARAARAERVAAEIPDG